MKKELFTAPEIAKICRTSRQNVNIWINKGVLKAFRPTDTAVWKVTRKDLITFMEERGYPLEFLNDDKIRILVVDDEKNITSLISRVLEKERNLKIDVANSGFKAGAKLTEFKPDIVILDIILGDIDGKFCRIHSVPPANATKRMSYADMGVEPYRDSDQITGWNKYNFVVGI